MSDEELLRLRADNERLRLIQAHKILASVFAPSRDAAPRPFVLYRHKDETGVSGSGLVAEGVQFSDGTVAVRWRGQNPSTVVWASMKSAMSVHGHNGLTEVVWLTEDPARLYEEMDALEAQRDEMLRQLAELRGEPS